MAGLDVKTFKGTFENKNVTVNYIGDPRRIQMTAGDDAIWVSREKRSSSYLLRMFPGPTSTTRLSHNPLDGKELLPGLKALRLCWGRTTDFRLSNARLRNLFAQVFGEESEARNNRGLPVKDAAGKAIIVPAASLTAHTAPRVDQRPSDQSSLDGWLARVGAPRGKCPIKLMEKHKGNVHQDLHMQIKEKLEKKYERSLMVEVIPLLCKELDLFQVKDHAKTAVFQHWIRGGFGGKTTKPEKKKARKTTRKTMPSGHHGTRKRHRKRAKHDSTKHHVLEDLVFSSLTPVVNEELQKLRRVQEATGDFQTDRRA